MSMQDTPFATMTGELLKQKDEITRLQEKLKAAEAVVEAARNVINFAHDAMDIPDHRQSEWNSLEHFFWDNVNALDQLKDKSL